MTGPELDPAALPREVDLLHAALESERYRHVAGLEPEPGLVRLFDARSRGAHRATVAALRERGDALLADAVARLRTERAQAEDEERWRAADAAATGVGPDGPRPLAALELALPREPDRSRRLALARAAADALERAAGDRERAIEARARAAAEIGIVPDWPLVVEGDGLLGATDDAWRDLLAWSSRRALGIAPRPEGDLRRADLLFVLALARWDGLFRPGMLAVALKLAAEGLGLDLGRVRIDDADRPAQWPGAHAIGARVSLRRRGGAADWLDLFRAAGAAIAASHAPARLRAPAFAAGFGALCEGLLLDPRFLALRADVEKRDARDLVRALALRTLFRLRAHAAALRIATEVERGLSGGAWREAYRDALTSATGAEWDAARAARDGDAAVHAAALGGAGLAARWRRELRERFDEDWWRNPRTAAHLAALLAGGGAPATAPIAPGGLVAAPAAEPGAPEPRGLDVAARELVDLLA